MDTVDAVPDMISASRARELPDARPHAPRPHLLITRIAAIPESLLRSIIMIPVFTSTVLIYFNSHGSMWAGFTIDKHDLKMNGCIPYFKYATVVDNK
jgi:hypothetical protein